MKKAFFKRTKYFVAALTLLCATLSPMHRVYAVVDICTWTGAVDTNWSTSGNWSCSTDGAAATPEPNDALVFPESASNKSTNNDIAAGTAFSQIDITGSGYTVGGERL